MDKFIAFGTGRNKVRAILTVTPDFEAGDQPPPKHAYTDWHAWAEVQHKAGLRQVECGKCGLWKYPQELSDKTIKHTLYKNKKMTKPVHVETRVCNDCAALDAAGKGEV